MSRPLIGSGQWSQTTTGIFHPADRLKKKQVDPKGESRFVEKTNGFLNATPPRSKSAQIDLKAVNVVSKHPLYVDPNAYRTSG